MFHYFLYILPRKIIYSLRFIVRSTVIGSYSSCRSRGSAAPSWVNHYITADDFTPTMFVLQRALDDVTFRTYLQSTKKLVDTQKKLLGSKILAISKVLIVGGKFMTKTY